MRLAHMNNAKSREHAHTCRKARAIFKLRYKKKKKKKSAEWHNMFDLPSASLGGYVFIHEQLRGLVGLRTSSQVHP